jgi:hypothetical protein
MSNLHLLPPGVDVIDAEAPYPGGWAWRYSVSVEMPSAREELGAEETIEILASPTAGPDREWRITASLSCRAQSDRTAGDGSAPT